MQGNRRHSEYRDDNVPSQLYESSSAPRLSDASMFNSSGPVATQRGRFPWRTALVAAVLFLTGLTFLLLATLHFSKHDNETELAFIIMGSIAFLPGAYAAFNIVQWYRGVHGFHLSDFAHWDEDQ